MLEINFQISVTAPQEADEDELERQLCSDKGAGEWFRLETGKDKCRDVIQCTASVRTLFTINFCPSGQRAELSCSPKATVTLVPVWKQGVSKQGILKSIVSHFMNFKSWIKLIYDTVDVCNFVINEFNSTFEVQNMGNEAFQNISFGNASFPNEALSYSCLWE